MITNKDKNKIKEGLLNILYDKQNKFMRFGTKREFSKDTENLIDEVIKLTEKTLNKRRLLKNE